MFPVLSSWFHVPWMMRLSGAFCSFASMVNLPMFSFNRRASSVCRCMSRLTWRSFACFYLCFVSCISNARHLFVLMPKKVRSSSVRDQDAEVWLAVAAPLHSLAHCCTIELSIVLYRSTRRGGPDLDTVVCPAPRCRRPHQVTHAARHIVHHQAVYGCDCAWCTRLDRGSGRRPGLLNG
jgi:hypothetical protein